jgi:hypothetical protein
MRAHPISPVTEPLQYRAIGVVRGVFEPADPEQLTRGLIRTVDGEAIEAVVLGRLLTLMRRHLDLAEPHLWVVYPRSREPQGLHLQMVGVWEPSTLAATAAVPEAVESPAVQSEAVESAVVEPEAVDPVAFEPAAVQPAAVQPESVGTGIAVQGDALPEGDEYFSVRGELIYTRPETGDLVIKVRQQPRSDGSKPVPFKLQLKGVVPLEHLRHFVALDLRRQAQDLQLERFEVIGPMAVRGTRGGKGRRDGSARSHGGGNRRSAISRPRG